MIARVDGSMGKYSELLRVGIKIVNLLERGLAPSELGEATAPLFLEQIDALTAYQRYSHSKTPESLGDFVGAMTDVSIKDQVRGRTKNTG